MKIAYFDCFSGISGDMTVGAFIDAGFDAGELRRQLRKLPLSGYEIRARRVKRGALTGTKFDCVLKKPDDAHRKVSDVLRLIDKSSLDKGIKETASSIFLNLGRAEAKVHGLKRPESVALHEAGGIDSIVDIVGASIAVAVMGIGQVRSSVVTAGSGYAETAHGVIPVPGPAAMELLKGARVRTMESGTELVTPTGAAILMTLAKGFGPMPALAVKTAGYGAGSRDGGAVPNMLRVVIGEAAARRAADRVTAIETNIDDMNPQFFERVFDRLFRAGALDVYVTNVLMKKMRPGYKLTVLARSDTVDGLCDILFSETTTIGLRFSECDRLTLGRRIERSRTRFGSVRVKVSGEAGGALSVSPEYDDCARIARAKGVPVKAVYDEAKNRYNR